MIAATTTSAPRTPGIRRLLFCAVAEVPAGTFAELLEEPAAVCGETGVPPEPCTELCAAGTTVPPEDAPVAASAAEDAVCTRLELVSRCRRFRSARNSAALW